MNNPELQSTCPYEQLKQELITENDLASQNSDLITACKIGFRKLRIAKSFCQIDEKIIDSSTNKSDPDSFFSGILFLEAKRLAFKEEATKCSNEKTQINL